MNSGKTRLAIAINVIDDVSAEQSSLSGFLIYLYGPIWLRKISDDMHNAQFSRKEII